MNHFIELYLCWCILCCDQVKAHSRLQHQSIQFINIHIGHRKKLFNVLTYRNHVIGLLGYHWVRKLSLCHSTIFSPWFWSLMHFNWNFLKWCETCPWPYLLLWWGYIDPECQFYINNTPECHFDVTNTPGCQVHLNYGSRCQFYVNNRKGSHFYVNNTVGCYFHANTQEYVFSKMVIITLT